MSRRPLAAVAAMLAAVGVFVLVPSAGAARARPVTWHLVYTGPRGYEIQGIAAASKRQAWAFGTVYGAANAVVRHFYRHWNGRSWQRTVIPAAAGIFPGAIQASSASNVWIFGDNDLTETGAAIVYNGRSWTAMPAPLEVESELVVSITDVWVTTSDGTATVATHWNGSAWQPYTVPGQLKLAGGGSRPWLVGVAASGQPGHTASLEAVDRWNGSRWQHIDAPAPTAAHVMGVGATDGRLWLATQAGDKGIWRLYRRAGGSWRRLATPRSFVPGASPANFPPVFDGHGGFWNPPHHWTGSRWVNTAPGMPLKPRWLNTFWYNNVAPVPGTSSVWAVVLANQANGTARSGIAVYGPTP